MKFYNELLKLSDTEIEKLVEYRIEYLEKYSDIKDHIGFNIEDNYKKVELKTKENIARFDIFARCFVPGYIKNGTKIYILYFFGAFAFSSLSAPSALSSVTCSLLIHPIICFFKISILFRP